MTLRHASRNASTLSAATERASDAAAARSAAVALLARRDFASGELQGRLTARGFEAQAAAQAVSELAAQGLLSDERFAHNFVAYHAGRGQGPLRIAAELRARGLAQPLIDEALASGPDWRALAAATRVRRFGPTPPGSWAAKVRQARFLQYRGFSADHIRVATGTDPDTD